MTRKKRIRDRGEAIKRMVEEHVSSVLEKLSSRKLDMMRNIQRTRDELQRNKIILENFKKYRQEVVDKADPAEVARVANLLFTRAKQLKNQPALDVEIPEINFHPSNFKVTAEQPGSFDNIVGQISSEYISFIPV